MRHLNDASFVWKVLVLFKNHSTAHAAQYKFTVASGMFREGKLAVRPDAGHLGALHNCFVVYLHKRKYKHKKLHDNNLHYTMGKKNGGDVELDSF